MMTIYRLLGTRRREQVRRALSKWPEMRYVRLSPLLEREILEAWRAGGTTKIALARRLHVARNTIYRVVQRSIADEPSVTEPRAPTVTDMDIAWLAGLVEGEGNISINGRSLTLRIKMGDRDVISWAATLLGAKVYSAAVSDPKGKPMWLTQVKSSTAAAWIMTIYPWLGVRRRKQARDAMAFWRRQGHGAIAKPLADTIVAYRVARFSQTEIMALFKVSKSTVYRHTKAKVRRMHVTGRHDHPNQLRECHTSYYHERLIRASAPRYCDATRSDAGCPLTLIRTPVSSSAVGVMRYIASSCST
jgi:transposase